MRSLTDMAAEIEGGTQAEQQLTAEGIPAGPEKVRRALMEGGRATVTARSLKTEEHVTVTLVCRKKKPGGQGWVSRGTTAGRVGFEDADCIEARDPRRDYPDNYVGRFYKDTGEWRTGRDVDPARAWLAEKVIAFALGGFALHERADVFLAAECCMCGHRLEDPQSIERGIGPECFGRSTSSKKAAHQPQLGEVV